MKKLQLNKMENVKGGTSGRGCMLMGAASVIACAIPGGGLIAGISIFVCSLQLKIVFMLFLLNQKKHLMRWLCNV
ncbi:hypothetical protein [Flavobacterium ginsengisoli]|uniref:hypothetical protein n=1 Tax=Flavobacterium ginsengisoli TaxID=871694 RepID=UPI002415941E|nr:hypothetical protein [Flavobacterium ginsengisoli]